MTPAYDLTRRAGDVIVLLAVWVARANAQCADSLRGPPVPPAAKEAVLWGVVRQEGSCRPIAGALVRIDSMMAGAVSDSLGLYVIRHVERTRRSIVWARANAVRGGMFYPEARQTSMFSMDGGIVVATSRPHKRTAPVRPPAPSPGYAVRLDFWMRPWRIPF